MMIQQTSAQMASHVRFGKLNDKQKADFYELFAPNEGESHKSLSTWLNGQQTADLVTAELRDAVEKRDLATSRKALATFNSRIAALAIRLGAIETEGDVEDTEGMNGNQIRQLPESDTIKGDNSDILTREAIKRAQDMVDLYTRVKSVSAKEFDKAYSAVVQSWGC